MFKVQVGNNYYKSIGLGILFPLEDFYLKKIYTEFTLGIQQNSRLFYKKKKKPKQVYTEFKIIFPPLQTISDLKIKYGFCGL